MNEPVDKDKIVWQPRCVFCGMEHYALNVYALSQGNSGCHNCGRTPPVYTDIDEYRAAVRRAREART